MSQVIAALILFELAALAGVQTRDGFRAGKMPALGSSRITPFVFDRCQAPAWFWGAAIVNLVMTAVLAAGGLVLLFAAVRG